MNVWARRAVAGLAISVVGYFATALGLTLLSSPVAPTQSEGSLDFQQAMTADYSALPPLIQATMRDGEQLGFRQYGNADKAHQIVILIHGSGWHGMQFHKMAQALAENAGRLVVVPDLRGHGVSPTRRGDIDHIGQYEEDLSDLIDHLRQKKPDMVVILGGHSSGGGLVVRFAGGDYGQKADGFMLMAPFLKYNAPTVRLDANGWAGVAVPRIIGLAMLNTFGISRFNDLPVIAFAFPRAVLEGPMGKTATKEYSFRLNTSYAPRLDYQRDLAAMKKPTLVLAGDKDEAFYAEKFQEVISAQTKAGEYHVLPGVTHIGLPIDDGAIQLIDQWLNRHFPLT